MNDEELKKEYLNIDKNISNFTSLLHFIICESFGEKIGILYSIINDKDKFAQILKAFGGMNINFPTIEEFKSFFTLTLVFYYKEIMHFSWKKIEELIVDEKDISLKYGSKIKTLQKSIKKYLINIEKHNIKENELFDI